MLKSSLIALLFILGFVETPAFSQTSSACKPNRGWCPGTFRGLTVGKSTYGDMVRILGKPSESGPAAEQDGPQIILWHGYGTIKGSLSGSLAVETDRRTNKIVSIIISPVNMTKDEVVSFFGEGYTKMSYEFCMNLDDTTGAPVFENSRANETNTGTIFIEYRPRGIAVQLDDHGKVQSIEFVAAPIGLASKKDCDKDRTSKRQ